MIIRDPNSSSSERTLQLRGGGEVRVDLVMAIKSPNGNVFLAHEKLRHNVSVLAPPRPTQIQMTHDKFEDDDAIIIDLAKQQQLKEQALLAAKRARRNRILGAAASILAIIGVTAGYKSMQSPPQQDPCNEISISDFGKCSYGIRNQISTSDFYRISQNGNLLVYRIPNIKHTEG